MCAGDFQGEASKICRASACKQLNDIIFESGDSKNKMANVVHFYRKITS